MKLIHGEGEVGNPRKFISCMIQEVSHAMVAFVALNMDRESLACAWSSWTRVPCGRCGTWMLSVVYSPSLLSLLRNRWKGRTSCDSKTTFSLQLPKSDRQQTLPTSVRGTDCSEVISGTEIILFPNHHILVWAKSSTWADAQGDVSFQKEHWSLNTALSVSACGWAPMHHSSRPTASPPFLCWLLWRDWGVTTDREILSLYIYLSIYFFNTWQRKLAQAISPCKTESLKLSSKLSHTLSNEVIPLTESMQSSLFLFTSLFLASCLVGS